MCCFIFQIQDHILFLFDKAQQEAEEKAKKEAEEKSKKEAEEKSKKEAEEKAKLCVVSYPRFKINYCFYLPGRLLKRQRPRRRPKTRPNRKLKTRQSYMVFHFPDSRSPIISICMVGQEGGRRQG